MWHEARKHEKKLRVMIVDYRRRAERRREFYEKFRLDPAQFMQVHGRPCKIHVDSQITAAAEKCLMPWQGQSDNLIDRFDGRAMMDIIPEAPVKNSHSKFEEEGEEVGLNYERYRILIQNDVAGISEDKFLHQIHIEEQYGTPTPSPFAQKAGDPKSVKLSAAKAAIGYTYENSASSSSAQKVAPQDNEDDSEEDIDFDLIVNVNDLTIAQTSELNQVGTSYGMAPGSFMTFLNNDVQEREQMRTAKLQEEEKQAMRRKARRERRAYKDKTILRKGCLSPPSYAAPENAFLDPENEKEKDHSSNSDNESHSRKNSPDKITFITSFGENDSDKERSDAIGPNLASALPRKRRMEFTSHRSASRSRKFEKWTSRSPSPYRKRYRFRSNDRSGTHSRRHGYRKTYRSRSNSRNRSSGSYKHQKRSSSSSSSSREHKKAHKSRSDKAKRRRSRSKSPSLRYSRKHKSSIERSRSRRRSASPRRHPSSPIPLKKFRSSSASSNNSSMSNSEQKRLCGNGDDSLKEKRHTNATSNQPPSPPVKRYYGRHGVPKDDEDSPISLSSASEAESLNSNCPSKHHERRSNCLKEQSTKAGLSSSSKVTGTSCSSSKGVTQQERLKRKMQAALNKQLKADKEAERSRLERLEQERLEREESLRELSIKYRKRERERRHQSRNTSSSSESSSDTDNSKLDSDEQRSPSLRL